MRRARHRLAKIDHRLEVLEGLMIAFLNLDRVIDIIRYDDDPKLALMFEDWSAPHQSTIPRATSEADYASPLTGVDTAALVMVADPAAVMPEGLSEDEDAGSTPHRIAGRDACLSDVQAEAILNIRLRSLRRLEEMELRAEQDRLMAERAGIMDLLEDDSLQWARVAEQLREVRKQFGAKSKGGARRTQLAQATEVEDVPIEAMIDREPITVVCSQMGWIRAMTGHIDLTRELKFKDGDGPRFVFHAETTDKLLVFGSNCA